MRLTTKEIKKRYNRAAKFYDILENPMELMGLRSWRVDLMKDLHGKVLEVGVGTGKNVEFYPDEAEITAIDFSEKMLELARLKVSKFKKKVTLIGMDVENLMFPDNTFDTVFTTCVFCSVPNPIKGLMEIKRVCKPGGKILMLEHVRSESRILGLIMDLFNPLTVNIYGANINRRTVENLYKSGFSNIEVVNLYKDIVKKIVILNGKQ